MKEPLFIEESGDTPKVSLDPANNKFELSGRSLPENSAEFYQPILAWMDDYVQSPNAETNMVINMFYFNTSSSKMVLDLLYRLEKLIEAGHKAEITWYCDEDDEDMEEMGDEFGDILAVPLTIKYNEED